MSAEAPATVEFIRFFANNGSPDGKVSIVVGGKMHVFAISRVKMFHAAESAMEALRYAESETEICAIG